MQLSAAAALNSSCTSQPVTNKNAPSHPYTCICVARTCYKVNTRLYPFTITKVGTTSTFPASSAHPNQIACKKTFSVPLPSNLGYHGYERISVVGFDVETLKRLEPNQLVSKCTRFHPASLSTFKASGDKLTGLHDILPAVPNYPGWLVIRSHKTEAPHLPEVRILEHGRIQTLPMQFEPACHCSPSSFSFSDSSNSDRSTPSISQRSISPQREYASVSESKETER